MVFSFWKWETHLSVTISNKLNHRITESFWKRNQKLQHSSKAWVILLPDFFSKKNLPSQDWAVDSCISQHACVLELPVALGIQHNLQWNLLHLNKEEETVQGGVTKMNPQAEISHWGPRVNSQDPCGSSQLSITPVQNIQLFWPLRILYMMHRHTCWQNTQTYKIKLNTFLKKWSNEIHLNIRVFCNQ